MIKINKFDPFYYAFKYKNAVSAVACGEFGSYRQHFERCGAARGYNPNDMFTTTYYNDNNPDVARAVEEKQFATVFDHFVIFGLREGRAPTARVASYFDAAQPTCT